MAKLTIRGGDNGKTSKKVVFNDFLTIGRDEGNNIVLRTPEVSLFHATISRNVDGSYSLMDLNSRNSTLVGGEPIKDYVLTHGTAFQIVNHLFTFFEDDKKVDEGKPLKVSRKIAIGAPKAPISNGAGTMFIAPPGVDNKGERFDSLPQQRLSLLLALSSEIISTLDYHELLERALAIAMGNVAANRGFIALKDAEGKLRYSGLKGFAVAAEENLRVSWSMINQVVKEGRSVLTANALQDRSFKEHKSVVMYELKSVMCVPLRVRERIIGCIYLDNPDQEGSFSQDDLGFFTILACQVAIAIESSRLYNQARCEVEELKKRLGTGEQLIVKSDEMIKLYQKVQKVAAVQVPVLVLGETGVGKELVARAVHNDSDRKGRFVALNCSALPENLIESELFGHEKGAFTGADMAKPGMFELASGGTIFLDEIGEMSPALQPKLLRILQDGKVMRLGGTKEIPVDVRVVAATNRDLKKMMQEESFRSDLYYRIAGVKLEIPPLRTRQADIVPLANYFLNKFARDHDRQAITLSHNGVKLLQRYDWPGNINELKNSVIQAAILGNGSIINPEDLPWEIQGGEQAISESFPALAEVENRHIRRALQLSKGNKKMAAKLLGITRATIYKKISKYGIAG